MNDSVKQAEICQAIVFDLTGKIMVATSKEDIKILSFENANIKLAHALLGHQKIINCLVFSQIGDYFFSGSDDRSIIFWKSLNNKWQSCQTYCIVAKKLIFFLCQDNTIKVWRVDYENNNISILYSLEKHNSSILLLSLNESERVLDSSQSDQIIIWRKALNNQQMFQQGVTMIENLSLNNFQVQKILNQIKLMVFLVLNGYYFVNYNQYKLSKEEFGKHKIFKRRLIYMAPRKNNSLCVFENVDGLYQENIRKRVQLNKSNKFYLNIKLFPIIYNKAKNLLCLYTYRRFT
ncbi:unnamed protein product [Paramecium octaurelia]|uniref:Uncharacterized protein n=1 Tax=Paramecium octaurelia TaxID=43137 RepID=A0A8S1URK3_PAROT|nr:unnamed protein product [Paramecium octaurelia]